MTAFLTDRAPWRLVVDAGGTNARMARADVATRALADTASYAAAKYETPLDAVAAFVGATGGLQGCVSCAVAAAGPVVDGTVAFTNSRWTLSATELSGMLGGVAVALVNDLQGVAAAVPFFTDTDAQVVVPAAPATSFATSTATGTGGQRLTKLAINVGTGFGASPVVSIDGQWRALASEPGYMTCAGAGASAGASAWGRAGGGGPVSVEDVLSGAGLRAAYRVGGGAADITAEALFAAAAAGDPAAEKARAHFAETLAVISGNLVLATAAWGGVYLTGGVIDGFAATADWAAFGRTFRDKAKMANHMAMVPVSVVRIEKPALVGLAHLEMPQQDSR